MEFKKGEIEGIIIKKLIIYNDERGFLVETFRVDSLPDNLQPLMSYISYTKPGIARGPHEHLKQTDIFCFIGPGNFKIKLWDNRQESKTYKYYYGNNRRRRQSYQPNCPSRSSSWL
jgi:dTDP-4-dehydrorhamnose 3,5-epimerase